jgi:hypothetical protein
MLKRTYYISALIIILTFILLYSMFNPWMIRCLLIDFSGMKEIKDNIYISSNTGDEKIKNILEIITESDQRIKDLWGEKKSDPVLLFCTDIEDFYKFGMYKSHGVARNFLFGSYIIIHPEAITTDVLSHELCHAELFHRVGYFNDSEIPSWFHEGLAMMVYKNLPESYLRNMNDMKILNDDFKDLESNEDFYSSPVKTNLLYLSALKEVSNWYNSRDGKNDLIRLVEMINIGYNFYDTYERIKPE